jgi:hypothetical protein
VINVIKRDWLGMGTAVLILALLLWHEWHEARLP